MYYQFIMDKVHDAIYSIGERLTADDSYVSCVDLEYNPAKGIIPRGLIYKDEGRDINGMGCVMVGLNPGKASDKERAFFASGTPTYEKFLSYWKANILQHPYYKRLRKIADELEFRGPILWTELVKCQSKENGQLSVQTIRDDINKYLFKELEVIPADWPLFGIGGKAFEILSYRFPDRLVLGVPHPTGSYGLFPKLFENQKLKQDIYNRIQEIIKVKKTIAIMLNGK